MARTCFPTGCAWRVGSDHCALLTVPCNAPAPVMDQVYGVGAGADGQLGLPKSQASRATMPGAGFASPIDIPGLANCRVTQVACGTSHSVFMSLDGRVFTVRPAAAA